MISFIQRVFFIPGLLARFHRFRSIKAFVPLKEAKSIGILADVRKSGNLQSVVQFARSIQMQDLNCHLLVIVPDKRKGVISLDYEKSFPGMQLELICQDELNLIKAPKKEQINSFTSSPFDIVIYLDTEQNFSLEFVLWQSQAKMFAGPEGYCHGILDFEIGLNERSDLPYLAENLLKYLQLIQNRQESRQEFRQEFRQESKPESTPQSDYFKTF